jgi:hypothetical protein
MSDGNRGKRPEAIIAASFCAVALIGALILLYILGTLNGREAERREQTPASYSQAAKADAQRSCAGREGTAAFECIYERVESSQEQARGEQDLSAQQRAATSALAAAVIALLTLTITGIGVWFVKRTLDATLQAVEDTSKATHAMREANEIARDMARHERRPYLYPNRTEILRTDNGWVDVLIELKNFGRGPARKLELVGKNYTTDFPFRKKTHFFLHKFRLPDCAPGADKLVTRNFRYSIPGEHIPVTSTDFTLVVRLRYTYADEIGGEYEERYTYYIDYDDVRVGARLFLGTIETVNLRRRLFDEDRREPTLFDPNQPNSEHEPNHDPNSER